MSMFDDSDFQARGAGFGISGAETDFGENASAAYTATLFSFRTDQFNQAVTEAYDEEIERVFAVTGKKLPNPLRDRTGPIGESLAKGQIELLGAGERRAFFRKRLEGPLMQNLVEQNFAEKVADFGLDAKLPSDFRARALEIQRETVARNEEIATRAGFFGSLGQFTGGAGATLTDPPVLLSMLIGAPWATGVIRAALIEGGIAGTVEAAIQPTIQAQRARAGLPSGLTQALSAIAFTAVGAGIFAGGLRGLVRGSRSLVDAVKGLGEPTREVRQAIAVLDRINDIQETSPFHAFSRADGEHAARFSRAQELLIDDAVGPRIRDQPISAVRDDLRHNRLTAKELELEGREAEAFAMAQTIRARLLAETRGEAAFDQAREIAAALNSSELFAEVLAALRDPPARPRPQSLVNFLTEEGGMIDVGGELAALGITGNFRPSLKRGHVQPLLRKTKRQIIGAGGRKPEDVRGGLQPMRRRGEPMTPDEAAELASEAGFFPMSGDRVSINDLLEALDQEINRDTPLFRAEDVDELAVFDTDAENLDFIQRRLDDLGIDVNQLDDLQVRAIIDDLARAPVAEPRASPGELRGMSESRGVSEAIDEGAKNSEVLDGALEAEVRDIYGLPPLREAAGGLAADEKVVGQFTEGELGRKGGVSDQEIEAVVLRRGTITESPFTVFRGHAKGQPPVNEAQSVISTSDLQGGKAFSLARNDGAALEVERPLIPIARISVEPGTTSLVASDFGGTKLGELETILAGGRLVPTGAEPRIVKDGAFRYEITDFRYEPTGEAVTGRGPVRVTMDEGELSAKEVFDDLEEWDNMLAEWRDCIARVEI